MVAQVGHHLLQLIATLECAAQQKVNIDVVGASQQLRDGDWGGYRLGLLLKLADPLIVLHNSANYLFVLLELELPTRPNCGMHLLAGVALRHSAQMPQFGAAEEVILNDEWVVPRPIWSAIHQTAPCSTVSFHFGR